MAEIYEKLMRRCDCNVGKALHDLESYLTPIMSSLILKQLVHVAAFPCRPCYAVIKNSRWRDADGHTMVVCLGSGMTLNRPHRTLLSRTQASPPVHCNVARNNARLAWTDLPLVE